MCVCASDVCVNICVRLYVELTMGYLHITKYFAFPHYQHHHRRVSKAIARRQK